jgi:Skp family chaperone for outer membrane proteins
MRLQKLVFIILLSLIFNAKAYANENKYQSRIAVVDVVAILERAIAVQSINQSISKISEGLQKEMSAKEVELKKSEEDIIKKRSTLKEEDFEKEVISFNKRASDAQNLMQSKKAKLEQAHAEAIAKVHDATIDIIHNLSKEYGFNLAIPSSQILYVKEDLNITEEVIKKLNEKLKTVPVNYK